MGFSNYLPGYKLGKHVFNPMGTYLTFLYKQDE